MGFMKVLYEDIIPFSHSAINPKDIGFITHLTDIAQSGLQSLVVLAKRLASSLLM